MQLHPKKFLKGAFLLSIGQAAGYGLSFVRNLILARLLTKADFGLAAVLSVSLTLLEMVSRMSFGVQIIQAPEGDDPEYQGVAHAVQALIGMVSAALVLAAARPMAVIFHHPELAWAFGAMAVVPFVRGFLHLDLARFQRQYNYSAQVGADILPQLLATAAAWPLALWLRDFRAVLWIMLGKEIATLLASHLLAERPYRWSWRPGYARGMWSFGWPLLLNGLLIFGAQQGDQMVVGAGFSVEDLAGYSIAFSLTSVAWAVFTQVGGALMLPVLSQYQGDQKAFELHYRRCLELAAVGSMMILGPLMVAGGPIVRVLFGPKYSGAGPLIAVFSVVTAFRLLRWAPAVGALARADTAIQLYGNLARAAGLPLALALVGAGFRSLLWVAACGLAGEALALVVTLWRVQARQGIRFHSHGRALLFFAGWLTVAWALHNWLGDAASVGKSLAATLGLWVACGTAAAALLPALFALCRRALTTSGPGLLAGVEGR